MQIEQKSNVEKAKSWDVDVVKKQKKNPLRNRNGVSFSSHRDILAPVSEDPVE